MTGRTRSWHLVVTLLLAEALLAGSAFATLCLPRDRVYQFALNAWNTNEHRSGSHESFTRFNYACQCDQGCRSSCTPNLSDSRCLERGRLRVSGFHRAITSSRLVGGSKANALTSGAPCGSGFGCFIQHCPGGWCAPLNVSVSGQPVDVGVKVVFTTSVPTVWDGQLDWPFECDACEPRASVPPGNRYLEQQCIGDCGGGGGGGSGGGSGSGGWCFPHCSSITLSGGTAYEVCTLICT